MVIRSEVEAEILRLHHVEKWPIGTIAAQLNVHHDVVTRVIASGGACSGPGYQDRSRFGQAGPLSSGKRDHPGSGKRDRARSGKRDQ